VLPKPTIISTSQVKITQILHLKTSHKRCSLHTTIELVTKRIFLFVRHFLSCTHLLLKTVPRHRDISSPPVLRIPRNLSVTLTTDLHLEKRLTTRNDIPGMPTTAPPYQ